MRQFSGVDAALEGFRLTRERPRDVLVWALLTLAFTLLVSILAISIAGEAFNQFRTFGQRQTTDPSEAMETLSQLLPMVLVMIPLALLYNAVFYTAVYRAVLRPQEGGPGHLKLGADEFRVLGAFFLLMLLFAVGVFVATMIVGITFTVGGAGALIGVLILLAAIVGLIWVSVRLSFALPMTFAEGRIRIFASWGATKGRFWPLFGAYLMAIVLAIVLSILASMILFAIAAIVGGGLSSAMAAMQPDYASFSTWLTPVTIVSLLLNSIITAVTTAVIVAPQADAYRQITGYGTDTAEVFA